MKNCFGNLDGGQGFGGLTAVSESFVGQRKRFQISVGGDYDSCDAGTITKQAIGVDYENTFT